MRESTLHKLAVVWLALWFGVIVPGHKRGLVLLPGGEPPVQVKSVSGETCPLAGMMGTTGSCCPTSSPPSSPAPLPVSHCAVCYLAGVLDVPPAPDLAPKPLELLEVLAWPAPVAVASSPMLQTYLGRAPPRLA